MKALRNRMRLPLGRRDQRGVVLFIALIVLVAMTLAGIAIMRSVDTGNLIAGNVAFKQGTLSAADRGIDEAFKYLKDNVLTTQPRDGPAGRRVLRGRVRPAQQRLERRQPCGETPRWWERTPPATPSPTLIHRMCDLPGKYTTVNCAQTPRTGGKAGNSMGVGGSQFTSTPVVYYRVTVRVQGPRDTLSIVQSNIGIQH